MNTNQRLFIAAIQFILSIIIYLVPKEELFKFLIENSHIPLFILIAIIFVLAFSAFCFWIMWFIIDTLIFIYKNLE